MKKRKRILLVDDEPNILIALEFLLKKEGYTTETAQDGVQALEKMTTFKPHIMVLDVMMPALDGFEVARTVRNMPKFKNTTIVFLTAKGTEKDKATGYEQGGEYYLIKPFDNDEFVRIINELAEFG
jgi:DNA-binding response OmpR family regulator